MITQNTASSFETVVIHKLDYLGFIFIQSMMSSGIKQSSISYVMLYASKRAQRGKAFKTQNVPCTCNALY